MPFTTMSSRPILGIRICATASPEGGKGGDGGLVVEVVVGDGIVVGGVFDEALWSSLVNWWRRWSCCCAV
jgi:hypothetical protein